MLVAAGLLLRLCTQLLRLVRLCTRLGLPPILVVGDSRPANLNESPHVSAKTQPRASGALLWQLAGSKSVLEPEGRGGLFRDRADEALFPTCPDDAATS